MFNLDEDCELVLPMSIQSVVSTLGLSGELGYYGDESPWPIFTLPDGRVRDLRVCQPKSARDESECYVKGRMPEGWCKLKYHRRGITLTLSFPENKVPYLAILPNEGGWQDLYNIFLESATASFDRIEVARLHGELSTVGPGSVGSGTWIWRSERERSSMSGGSTRPPSRVGALSCGCPS